MKGKSILLGICVLIATFLLCMTIYLFHKYGQFSFLMFYGAWVLLVFGILRFYSDKSPSHDHDHHDAHHHDGHDGHPQPNH